MGFSSIRGTCLKAAAWKIFVGRYFSKSSCEEWGVVDVAEDGDELRRSWMCCGREFGIYFVEILFGMIEQDHGAACVPRSTGGGSIAEPMLPPAPVIRITSFGEATSFEEDSVDASRFAVTGSRRERSGMSTGEREEDAVVYGDGMGEDGAVAAPGTATRAEAAAQCGAGGFCIGG